MIKTINIVKSIRDEDEFAYRINLNISKILIKIMFSFRKFKLHLLRDDEHVISAFIYLIANDVLYYKITNDFVDTVTIADSYLELLTNVFFNTDGREQDILNFVFTSLRDIDIELDDISDHIKTSLIEECISSKKIIGLFVEKVIYNDIMLLSGICYLHVTIKK